MVLSTLKRLSDSQYDYMQCFFMYNVTFLFLVRYGQSHPMLEIVESGT